MPMGVNFQSVFTGQVAIFLKDDLPGGRQISRRTLQNVAQVLPRGFFMRRVLVSENAISN